MVKIRRHHDLEVYQRSLEAAMVIFDTSRSFPREEVYSLTGQCRRASRSVCANLPEAWRKRRYTAAFVAKLSDAETEAAEMQVWIEFAVRCGYVDRTAGAELYRTYDRIIARIVGMITHPETWVT